MNWLNIPNIDVYAVVAILVFFAALEVIHGHYHETNRNKHDWTLELVGFFVVAATKTLQVVAVVWLGDTLLPAYSNVLSSWSIWLAIPFYLLIDDISQYWYHRSAHEYEWLWKHHRVHHAAKDMGILVSYRNSWVYYLLMPNLWWGAICTYLGLAPAVIVGLILKQIVVTASHSTWTWDRFWYRHQWLNPVTTAVERIFVTPAFHYSHHGRSMADNISDPNGNFGNTFSLWDQLFGTAKFTRQYPSEFGLQEDTDDPWYAHLLYPFMKAPKAESELSKTFKKEKQTGTEPYREVLQPGTYLYCQCGYSMDQPFCNGYHNGTKIKPMKFEVKSERRVSLCTCKLTKTPPYCDDSHLSLRS